MWLDNPVDLVEYCQNNGLADDLAGGYVGLYWGGTGKFIDYRGGKKVRVMGDDYSLGELAVIAVDGDKLTITAKAYL